MQVHEHHLDIEATPEELWRLFWFRGERPTAHGVSIEILHPGNALGEGLVRHCTFPVPRYLLSGGVGQSWEWLTEVHPPVSWRYEAIGKPLWSRAEGFTRLENLGGGRTRIHFSERYHAFNPLARALLERRVHRFISTHNEKVMAAGLDEGLRRLRGARRERS